MLLSFLMFVHGCVWLWKEDEGSVLDLIGRDKLREQEGFDGMSWGMIEE